MKSILTLADNGYILDQEGVVRIVGEGEELPDVFKDYILGELLNAIDCGLSGKFEITVDIKALE